MEADMSWYQHPWVILKLENEFYGVATPYVMTMVAMPDIVDVPYKPSWSRGVVNLRGQVMPLVDLRLRLDMQSYISKIEGLVDMVQHREKDHHDWLNELESSVREKREFTLATDPHKCKFGQWYDKYRPVSLTETQLLQQFKDPHQRIHHISHQVRNLVAENNIEQALALIDQTRKGDFVIMQKLFGDFSKLMRELARTEIALVLEHNHKRVSVAVDAVDSVEMLAENTIEQLPEAVQQDENPLAPFVAKRKKTGHIVYLLDAHQLIAESSGTT
jgi:chemotaxis signal transduction protein